MHSAFVAEALANCQEAADAVEGAHKALVASGDAQAQLLERTVAAQHAAAQQALVAAQANVAATIRCRASCCTAAPGCGARQTWPRRSHAMGISSQGSKLPKLKPSSAS